MKKDNKLYIRLLVSILSFTIAMIVSAFIYMKFIYEEPPEHSYMNPEIVTWDTFHKALTEKKIDTVYIDSESMEIRYTTINDETKDLTFEERNKVKDQDKDWYKMAYPGYEGFRKDVLESGAQIKNRSWGSGYDLGPASILRALYMVMSIGIIVYMLKFMSGSAIGQQSALSSESSEDVSFDDVIGQEEVIRELKDNLKVFSSISEYKKLGIRPPKGFLLIGPPGTGKTMIAKACAKEAGMKFLYINSSNCINMFVGQGAASIRRAFKEARKQQPCILFFDEIDSIGTKRGDTGGGVMEYKQTLDALLQEMDGFASSDRIYCMAATNLYETLDEALVRPGRFDRKVYIGPPRDAATRKRILEHYLKQSQLAKDVDLMNFAMQLSGMSGADIAQIANEAKLIAVRENSQEVHMAYLDEAMEKAAFMGNRTKNEYRHDMEIVAHHESGHAVSMLLNGQNVARLSIIPNTSGVGGMVVNSEKESQFETKAEMEKEIKALYSGRISEELFYGRENVTTGASNDLQKATELIRKYIVEYGFNGKYSLLTGKDDSEQTREEMKNLAGRLYGEAREELETNKDIIKLLSEYALSYETLAGPEVKSIYEEGMLEKNDPDNREALQKAFREKFDEQRSTEKEVE